MELAQVSSYQPSVGLQKETFTFIPYTTNMHWHKTVCACQSADVLIRATSMMFHWRGKVIHDLHGASHYEDFLFIEGKCSDYI